MRKFFSYTGLLGAALALVVGLLLLNRLMTFRSELAQLKSDGFPVSLLDLDRPVVDGEVDGTKQFGRLEGPLLKFEIEMYKDEHLDREPDDAMIEQYHELDMAYPTVYPLISEIAESDVVAFVVGPDDSQAVVDQEIMRMQRVRSCARVLHFKAGVLAAEGDPDAGLRAAIEIFNITDAFASNPTMVAQLVRVACRGIGLDAAHKIIVNYQVSDDVRNELNMILESLDSSEEYVNSLLSERAFGVTTLSEMGSPQVALNGLAYLEQFQQVIDQSKLESFEQDLSFQHESSWLDGWVAKSIIPAILQIQHAHSRTRSESRAMRIINALTATAVPEMDPAKITPEYLVSLGVPKAMTIDTMTGEPMLIKRVEEEWIVYSVGQNLIDDGGMTEGNVDFVLGD